MSKCSKAPPVNPDEFNTIGDVPLFPPPPPPGRLYPEMSVPPGSVPPAEEVFPGHGHCFHPAAHPQYVNAGGANGHGGPPPYCEHSGCGGGPNGPCRHIGVRYFVHGTPQMGGEFHAIHAVPSVASGTAAPMPTGETVFYYVSSTASSAYAAGREPAFMFVRRRPLSYVSFALFCVLAAIFLLVFLKMHANLSRQFLPPPPPLPLPPMNGHPVQVGVGGGGVFINPAEQQQKQPPVANGTVSKPPTAATTKPTTNQPSTSTNRPSTTKPTTKVPTMLIGNAGNDAIAASSLSTTQHPTESTTMAPHHDEPGNDM